MESSFSLTDLRDRLSQLEDGFSQLHSDANASLEFSDATIFRKAAKAADVIKSWHSGAEVLQIRSYSPVSGIIKEFVAGTILPTMDGVYARRVARAMHAANTSANKPYGIDVLSHMHRNSILSAQLTPSGAPLDVALTYVNAIRRSWNFPEHSAESLYSGLFRQAVALDMPPKYVAFHSRQLRLVRPEDI